MQDDNADHLLLPDEATLEALVRGFYTRVQGDPLLAPVFGPKLEGHWDEHMATMVDFWSSVLLATGRYRGRPLAIHGELGEITPAMWDRWLQLFGATAESLCPPPMAELIVSRARQIAGHLSRGLARRGEPLAGRVP
ncbi:MAG: group III truncated hemoglobin [Acidobacteriota bacterium]